MTVERLKTGEKTVLEAMAEKQLNALRMALLGAPGLDSKWLDQALDLQADATSFVFNGILIDHWTDTYRITRPTVFVNEAVKCRSELFRDHEEKALTSYFENERKVVETFTEDEPPTEEFLLELSQHRTKLFRKTYHGILEEVCKRVFRHSSNRIEPVFTTKVSPPPIISGAATPQPAEERLPLDSTEYGTGELEEIVSAAAAGAFASSDEPVEEAHNSADSSANNRANKSSLERFTKGGTKA